MSKKKLYKRVKGRYYHTPPSDLKTAFCESAGTISEIQLTRPPTAPPLPRRKKYHVFFSYRTTSPDKDRVREIVRDLESKTYGYKCCLHERDFNLGRTTEDNIDACIAQSMRAVIILSNDYIQNDWPQFESKILLNPKHDIHFVPVISDDCDVPDSLSSYSYIDIRANKKKWWNRLLLTLQGDAPVLPVGKTDHVFVGHGQTPEELTWADHLLKKLETPTVGLRCLTSARDFPPGKQKSDCIEKFVHTSLSTVVIFSQSFVIKDWKLYKEAVLKKGVRFIPVMMEYCDVPELEDIHIVNATDDTSDWLSRLIEVLLQPDTTEDPYTDAPSYSSFETEYSKREDWPCIEDQVGSHIGSLSIEKEWELASADAENEAEEETTAKADTEAGTQRVTNNQAAEKEAEEQTTAKIDKEEGTQRVTDNQADLACLAESVQSVRKNITKTSVEGHHSIATVYRPVSDAPYAKLVRQSQILLKERLPPSCEKRRITGICFHGSENILLSDASGKALFLVDISGDEVYKLDLQSIPGQICTRGQNVYIVCEGEVVIVHIRDREMRITRRFQFQHYSKGIVAVTDDVIAITCGGKESCVRLLDRTGACVELICKDSSGHDIFKNPQDICASEYGNLLISDERGITCLIPDESVPLSYSTRPAWSCEVEGIREICCDDQFVYVLSVDLCGDANLVFIDMLGNVEEKLNLQDYCVEWPHKLSCTSNRKIAILHAEQKDNLDQCSCLTIFEHLNLRR